MLVHPQFDPIAINVFGLPIRWYGLMYLAGFVAFVTLARYRVRRGFGNGLTTDDIDDLLMYGVFGVILGGRLGYVLFYKPEHYLAHPAEMLQIWSGGMSFHGGFLGVLIAVAIFCWRRRKRWIEVMDFVAPMCPLGLAAGRLGNFINGELPGRPTTVPWGMWFPQADPTPVARHPSQLYQFALEGLLLFAILWWFSRKHRPPGQVSALFLIGYGTARSFVEFFRTPDFEVNLGAATITSGQLYSVPMIAVGLWMWHRAHRSSAAMGRD